jgi:hypothetical protein
MGRIGGIPPTVQHIIYAISDCQNVSLPGQLDHSAGNCGSLAQRIFCPAGGSNRHRRRVDERKGATRPPSFLRDVRQCRARRQWLLSAEIDAISTRRDELTSGRQGCSRAYVILLTRCACFGIGTVRAIKLKNHDTKSTDFTFRAA